MTQSSSLPAGRRHDLDWVRVLALGLLVLYHVGMFYVSWGWHIKSIHASPAIEPLMRLVNPWRLPLLFFVSGMALRIAMTRADPRRLLSRRTLRLGIPLLFGFLVLNAPQAYYELLAKGEVSPGFLAFWVQYLDFDFEFSIITPTWNHLWYLAYLLVYTFLVVALSPVLLPLAAAVLRIWPQRFRHWGLIVLLILPFLAYELLLSDRFPVTHTLIDDWFNHANSLTAMLLGYLAGGGSGLSQALDRFRRPLCWLSLALGALLVFGSTGEAVGAIRVIYGWAVVLALLGLARRHLNRRGKVLAYLNEAMLPYYVLHQTMIVCIGAWLSGLSLPVAAEASLVLGGTILSCLLAYEFLIRRLSLLRPLFGVPMWVRNHPPPVIKAT